MKDLCQVRKVKLIFQGAYSETLALETFSDNGLYKFTFYIYILHVGNRDCWVFGNHWRVMWNSLMAWLTDPSPIFDDRSAPLPVDGYCAKRGILTLRGCVVHLYRVTSLCDSAWLWLMLKCFYVLLQVCVGIDRMMSCLDVCECLHSFTAFTKYSVATCRQRRIHGGRGGRSPPRLGPKKNFIARPKNTHICKPPFAFQNVLKLTYSNLEFQNFPGEDPRTPSSRGR